MASGDKLEIDDVHGLAVVLERRDAVVPALKLDAVAAREITLQDVVSLAVAREVIINRADRVHLEDDVPGVTRRLQHMIAVELQHFDEVLVSQMQSLDQIHLVVEYDQSVHVGKTGEYILLHNTEIALLDVEFVHMRETAEGVGLQPRQVHVRKAEEADVLEAVEGIVLDRANAGREDEITDVGETGKGVTLYSQERIVKQQNHMDVGRAGERVALDVADLVVRQQQHRDVLQRGEREFLYKWQWSVLDGELAQPVQTTKGERTYGGDIVAIQGELAQDSEPGERVTLYHREIVLR